MKTNESRSYVWTTFLLTGLLTQTACATTGADSCFALFGKAKAPALTAAHKNPVDTEQGSQEFQESLRPVYRIDKTTATMALDWTKIKANVEKALGVSHLTTRLIIDGVEQPALRVDQTRWEKTFDAIGHQHDVIIQLREGGENGKIVHETYPVLMESFGSQTVAPESFTSFLGENSLKLDLPKSFLESSHLSDKLLERTVGIGYKKIVWTLTHSATPQTRELGRKYGLDLKVVAHLDRDGKPDSYQLTTPTGATFSAAASEIRIQNDAAFNGNAFLWDNEFVTLGSAARHPTLGQSTLDFHYESQLKNGAIPREVRHSNGISFHRYTDIKFGKSHDNDEFTNPNFVGWVENYIYSLSNPADGVKRFDKSLKSMTAYAKWMDESRSVKDKDGNFIGYWTSNLASGADNAPRGGGNKNKDNFHLYGWVDLLAQQIMLHKDMSEMHAIRGEWDLAAKAKDKALALQKLMNEKYWDEKRGFYFDLMPTPSGAHVRDVNTATQASFWPFLAGTASPKQVARMIKLQMTPERFGGSFPAASLSSDHPEFQLGGGYWRGGRWPPSLVVLAQGFENSGRPDEAFRVARDFWAAMSKVSDKTVYEFYGMKKDSAGHEQPIVGAQEGHQTRGDFVGWGGTPILYTGLRNVNGFKPVPAFQGARSDIPEWIKWQSKSRGSVLQSLPELIDTPEKQERVAAGYVEWNLFFAYGIDESTHLQNVFYRGQKIKSLTVTRLSADTYRITVDSDQPVPVQMNRFFDLDAPGTTTATPQAGADIVLVGGSQRSVDVTLNLRPK